MKYPADLSVQLTGAELARDQKNTQILRCIKSHDSAIRQTHAELFSTAEKFYLDGMNLIDVLDQEILLELGKLIGGQCYEAAALAMLVLRGNPTARLVYGTAENSPKTGERCDHSWAEFTAHGVPFVVDWTWFSDEICLPRIVHHDMRKTAIISTINYYDFWSNATARKLHQVMQDAGHSYVYPWLISWRTAENQYRPELLKRFAQIGVANSKALRGRYHDYWYFFDLLLRDQRFIRVPELALVL